MANESVKVGTLAIAKVGRNAIEVEPHGSGDPYPESPAGRRGAQHRRTGGDGDRTGTLDADRGKNAQQTLYGSFFREIATKENPRIRKSGRKGKFELNREV